MTTDQRPDASDDPSLQPPHGGDDESSSPSGGHIPDGSGQQSPDHPSAHGPEQAESPTVASGDGPGPRTFVAIGMDEQAQLELARRLRDIREAHDDDAVWARPEGWHVTLAFLGEVPSDRRDEIVEAIEAATAVLGRDPRVASHEPGGAAPDPDTVDAATDPRPGITAAGGHDVGRVRLQRAVAFSNAVAFAVTHDGWLTRLHAALVDELAGRFEHEPTREFRPHLTVCRLRGERHGADVAREISYTWDPVVFTPSSIDVYISHLGDGPARYESVASVPLD